MTMIEETAAKKPARRKPARRKKAAAKPRAPAAPPPLKTSAEFPGLTARDCCETCGPRCVISADGSGICSHPNKGGVRAADMSNPTVVARGSRAAKLLKHQKIEIKAD